MADTPSKGGSWTEGEKYQLLVQIIHQLTSAGASIKLAELNMPGRTAKSLSHMVTRIKAEAKEYAAASTSGSGSGSPRPLTTSARGAARGGRGRGGRGGRGARADAGKALKCRADNSDSDDDDDDDDDNDDGADRSHGSQDRKFAVVKKEDPEDAAGADYDDDDDGAADNDDEAYGLQTPSKNKQRKVEV